MPAMPRPRPPFLHRFKTRHGNFVWYVRRPGGRRIRIQAEFGTPEFDQAYQAAIAGAERRPIGRQKASGGSLAWLWNRYRETAAWHALAPATRKQRENIMQGVIAKVGDKPIAEFRRADIVASRDARAATPAQARNFLDAMRSVFRWAYGAELVKSDPTDGVKNPRRRKAEGFKPWAMEDVAAYIRKWPKGTRQYVWLHVLLYIGSRRGDAVQHGKQHVRAGVITFITEKGRSRDRIEVHRRIEPELAEAIATGPCGDLAFICGESGQPLKKESFGNLFKAACVEAGILDKSAHGLRKLSATIWAERGATELELMALFGWLTPSMAALYTRAARRRLLSLNAAARLSGTPAEHSMCPPGGKVGTPERKAD